MEAKTLFHGSLVAKNISFPYHFAKDSCKVSLKFSYSSFKKKQQQQQRNQGLKAIQNNPQSSLP